MEWRCLTSSSLLNTYADGEGIGQVFKVERRVTPLKTGNMTHEVEYGSTRLKTDRASAHRWLQLVRDHWHIENGSHYPHDVSFHEDASQLRWSQAHRAIAILNNVALGLIRQLDFDFVPSARRFLAANLQTALHLLC